MSVLSIKKDKKETGRHHIYSHREIICPESCLIGAVTTAIMVAERKSKDMKDAEREGRRVWQE
jgi:hypothetical protein